MRKEDALSELGAGPAASFAEAKAAFRRQAMRWHPDRNRAAGAEERFKAIRASFEALEALHAAGDWSGPESEERGQAAPREAGAAAHPRRPAPKVRKPWDPPEGPMFEVGEDGDDPLASGEAFFGSFVAIGARMASMGVSAKMAGKVLARGFDAYMASMRFEIAALGDLRLSFLRAFWARRQPGMFAAMAAAREECSKMGWASSVAQVADPAAELHVARGGCFFVFDHAAAALPQGEPTQGDLDFYREWIAAMPSLFSGLASNERALRFAMSMRGERRGPLWISQALGKSPKVAELFAPLGRPGQFATKEDWLSMAMEAGLSPRSLAGWIAAEPLGRLCSALAALGRRAAPYAAAAEARLAGEGEWRFAGAWASPEVREMGKAHRAWLAIKEELGGGLVAGAKAALGLRRAAPLAAARRALVFGPPSEAGEAASRLSAGGRGALAVAGCPLAAACAMRMFFDLASPLDFVEKAEAIEAHLGLAELAKPGPAGLDAMAWFDKALERRQASAS